MLGHVATDLAASLDLHHLLGSHGPAAHRRGRACRAARILLLDDDHLRLAASTGRARRSAPPRRPGRAAVPLERLRGLREPLVLTPDTEGVEPRRARGARRPQGPRAAAASLRASCSASPCSTSPARTADLRRRAYRRRAGRRRIRRTHGQQRAALRAPGAAGRRARASGRPPWRRCCASATSCAPRSTSTRCSTRVAERWSTWRWAIARSAIFLYDEATRRPSSRASRSAAPTSSTRLPRPRPSPERIFDRLHAARVSHGQLLLPPAPARRGTRRGAAPAVPSPTSVARGDDEWQTGDACSCRCCRATTARSACSTSTTRSTAACPRWNRSAVVEIFANQAAIAIENAQQYAALERAGAAARAPAPVAAGPAAGERVDARHARREGRLRVDRRQAPAARRVRHAGDQQGRLGSAAHRHRLRPRRVRRGADGQPDHASTQGLWGWAVTHDEAVLLQRRPRRPARRAGAGHAGRAAGVDRAAAARDEQGDRRAQPRPARRQDLQRGGVRARQAVRQPGGDRHRERLALREEPAARRHRPAHRPVQPRPLPGDPRARGAPLRALRRAASRCS